VLPDIEHYFGIDDGKSGLLQTGCEHDTFCRTSCSTSLSLSRLGLSGLGYIVGSQVSNIAKDWHWALRVTPALGLIAVLLLLFVVQEPKRGAIEARPEHHLQQTSWLKDLQALGKNCSHRPLGGRVFIFLGETFLSMNWAIVADILLLLLSQVSDSLRRTDSFLWQFRSLQLSLLLCSFVAVVGGAFFLATALFIETDRHRAENYVPTDDEPIVVPKSGRSTRVPVSSVLI
ncbi:protein spinster homolog 1-like, partial [Seriola lalandi dorsalis]|uniref:protein spinster homolog 1-like n=1 Tax=Seriola lalandi dorsalis TaxID=1841481 RepID=UPI000C6FBE6B